MDTSSQYLVAALNVQPTLHPIFPQLAENVYNNPVDFMTIKYKAGDMVGIYPMIYSYSHTANTTSSITYTGFVYAIVDVYPYPSS